MLPSHLGKKRIQALSSLHDALWLLIQISTIYELLTMSPIKGGWEGTGEHNCCMLKSNVIIQE